MPTNEEKTNLSPQVEIPDSGRVAIKTKEIGVSGIDISGFRFYEEYLDALTQSESADVYDEMRRSDDQVKMLLRVVSNPILSARWFITPGVEDDKGKRIADFAQFALFENLGTEERPKSFKKFQRETLLCVPFGYSLFERTDKIVHNDPEYGTYIGIKGLDWRSPKTIVEWGVADDGTLDWVKQDDYSQRSRNVTIPGRFLLHVAPEMEGDLYEGISMLRPIYGNWLRKNILLKIQMMGAERAATGVPIGKIPQGQLNSPSQDALEDSLSRFVAHERQYLLVPEGFMVEALKIAHDGKALDAMIRREDIGMAKSFLAAFMELGVNSSSGSWALGTDLSDIFLSGIELYADCATDSIDLQVIRPLVKSNFGPQRKYPKLKIEGINDKAGKEFAEVLQLLSSNDLIQITDRLKEVVHKRYNLPDFDHDLKEERPGTPPKASSNSLKAETRLSEMEYNLAEPSVGRNIEKVGKEMTLLMSERMRGRGGRLIERMMTIWRNVAPAKRREQVNKLTVPGKTDYKKLLANELADVYVRATQGVKKELASDGLKLAEPSEIKDLPAESKAAGASQADLLVDSQDADLRKNLFFSFTSKLDTLPTEAQMEANLFKVLEKYVTGASINTAGPNAVANAVNLARNAIFQRRETLDKIESFIFTNPSPEAKICVELTGRVFSKEEYVVSDKLPPLHHNCNSWIKAQITGRPGNKAVSPAGLTIQGTPDQIETIEKSITL
jgi:hypothetical protein